MLFQFHYGMIGSIADTEMNNLFQGFNSTMGWLEAYRASAIMVAKRSFNSTMGWLEVWTKAIAKGPIASFNSTMGWLEE